MEKIIHFTVPETLSELQSQVIERAQSLHSGWEIKVWRDPIARGGFLLEGYWPKANSGAQFADLLRLDVIYRYGGVYIDSDIHLFRPLDELVDTFEFFIASEDGWKLTNAMFGAKKQSPAVRCLIDELLSNEPDWKLSPVVTTGPSFFAKLLKWRKDVTVLPRETFYSYNWNHEGKKYNHRHTYAEHLWVKSWGPKTHSPEKPELTAMQQAKLLIKQGIKKMTVRSFRVWSRISSLDPKASIKTKINNHYSVSREIVANTIHGFTMVLDGEDLSITPEVVFQGFYELPEENFVKNVLRGGDWMIDVGSNVGSFSLLAAKCIGPFGRVFAYDPNPRVLKLLSKSLVMNWMHERVRVRQAAVGESAGPIEFSYHPDRLGDGQVNPAGVSGSTFKESMKTLGDEAAFAIQVNCVRLDEEFPVDLPIKILKIDVEGYEGSVLQGACRLLKNRCVDFVVLELVREVAGSRWEETLVQIQRALSYGYRICTLTEAGGLEEREGGSPHWQPLGPEYRACSSGTVQACIGCQQPLAAVPYHLQSSSVPYD